MFIKRSTFLKNSLLDNYLVNSTLGEETGFLWAPLVMGHPITSTTWSTRLGRPRWAGSRTGHCVRPLSVGGHARERWTWPYTPVTSLSSTPTGKWSSVNDVTSLTSFTVLTLFFTLLSQNPLPRPCDFE